MHLGLLATLGLSLPSFGPPPSLCQQDHHQQQPPILVAVTRSGVQVESVEESHKGDLVIHTPFGPFRTPTDPVEIQVSSSRSSGWRKLLDSDPTASIDAIVKELDDAGLLSELAELASLLLLEEDRASTLEAVSALEAWGARIDPVPSKVPSEDRIPWLYKQIRGDRSGRRILLCGRLEAEIMENGNGVGLRQRSLSQLRDDLRSQDPLLRRLAARVAQKQMVLEPALSATIFELSLAGPEIVRDAASAFAVRTWPGHAYLWWTSVLFRSEEDLRLLAAQNLARHLPQRSALALRCAASTFAKRAPDRYPFEHLKLQVVRGRLDPPAIFHYDQAGAFYNTASTARDPLEDSSVVKIVRISPDLQAVLAGLTGAGEAEVSEDQSKRPSR
ncbi:MAG: hypothetical protein H8E31_15465 [Planctomycetes bacterium]|nr:hypothetical protein [Planctomycetota bacterium]